MPIRIRYYYLIISSGCSSPGSGLFSHPGSWIQGSKKHRILYPDPQHWLTVGSYLRCRRAAEAQSAVTEAPPPPVVVDRSPEVEALQKKVDNLNRLLEGKVNEVVEVHKQLNVRIIEFRTVEPLFLFISECEY